MNCERPNLLIYCQKLKIGHKLGFQSTLPNNAVDGSAVSNVLWADSITRENSDHGSGLGAGQGDVQGFGPWVV